ncbi:MAG: TonB-dependent receptor [Cellvibrionaceae bacterium]
MNKFKKQFFHTPILLGILLLAFFPFVYADSSVDFDEAFNEMSLKELMELEVFTSASLLPTQASKAPGTVYSFSRQDFSRFGVRRIDDLLQFVPGLQLNQYRKRHQSIWARGLLDRYNDKLILLVDGIPMRHLYYGHFSLGDNFPLEIIEKVEIILGPASSLYGANAFGGIISITTRDFSDQPHVEVSAEIGNHERAKGNVFFNNRSVSVFGNYLSQDAPFNENRKSFVGGDSLQPLDEDYKSLMIKARPLEGLTLALNYFENDTPFLFIPNEQNAFVEERALSLSADYQIGNLETGKLEGNIYYQNDEAREFEREQLSQSIGYEEQQNAIMSGLSVRGLKRLNGNHILATGLSWSREEAKNTEFLRTFRFNQGWLAIPEEGSLLSDPKVTNDDYAVFIQDVWSVNPSVELTLGGRYDKFEQFDGYFNYRGAIVYTPDDRETWKLLYGTAIRTPSFREYLKVLEGTSFQPSTPDAERINSLEVGYKYQWDQVNLSLSAYRNTVEDFIREAPTPDLADEYFTNSSDSVHMQGLEMLMNIKAFEDLDLRFGLAYLKLKGGEFDDQPFLASWTGSFNLYYTYSNDHKFGLSLVHNNRRPDSNSYSEDDADSFVLMNVFASGKITPSVTYSAGIDNVLNSQVYDPAADFGNQYNTEKSEREIWFRLTWSPNL